MTMIVFISLSYHVKRILWLNDYQSLYVNIAQSFYYNVHLASVVKSISHSMNESSGMGD